MPIPSPSSEPGWIYPFRVSTGDVHLHRRDDETVDLAFYSDVEGIDCQVIDGLTRRDLTVLGGKLIRHGTHAVTRVPLVWADGTAIDPEERMRIALLRLVGCVCRFPLLGYTGGKATDGPRCRLCNTGIVFEETPDG